MLRGLGKNKTGNVGINDSTPSYTLEVVGNAGIPGAAWSDTSDERLKKNIKPLTGALDKLSKLKPVEYEWINPGVHLEGIRAGLIAQDVEKIFPGWVSGVEPEDVDKNLLPDGDMAKDLVLPRDFDAYLIQAIQELNQEKNSEITLLKSQIQELKDEIEKLKQ